MPARLLIACLVVIHCLAASNVLASDPSNKADPVSFHNDVQAVLSRAGCNQGTCHGNANGKGGFKLSLRGEDDEYDLTALVRSQFNRRVDLQDPAASLILLKATAKVPHEGGKRFGVDSPEYAILHRWISEGTLPDRDDRLQLVELKVTPDELVLIDPADEVQLSVEATFSDGSKREVNYWAVYTPSGGAAQVSPEGLVSRASFGEATVVVRYLDRHASVRLAFVPNRADFTWSDPPAANFIDELVARRLQQLRMNPSELASDQVFVRRVYLDTLGRLPTADEARRFLADTARDKRDRLIDRLTEEPGYADLWALRWSDLLRNEETTLDRKGVQNFHHWIRASLAQDKPLNTFVAELLTARGSTYRQPEANFYRAMRDPITRAESIAQVFLGVRLQCARCHNHPFDRWTQDDYYGWAAWFARVEYTVLANDRRDRNNKHEFVGEQIVWIPRRGEVTNARTGQPAVPRLLGEADAQLASDDDRLVYLANWLTAPDNPWLVRNLANRIWFHLMGRGIADPIDDFRDTNPPSNPELLDALATELQSHNFSLRHLVRTIMKSRTYQLSSIPNDTNADDQANFSHVQVRTLPAEVLLDCLTQATGATVRFNGYPQGTQARLLPGVRAYSPRERAASDAERFLAEFGKPPRQVACECERSSEATLNQALQLISGPVVNQLIADPENRLSKLLEATSDPTEQIDELYWSCLSRGPTEIELQAATAHVAKSDDRRAALEDVLWSLLNSKEFLLRP